MSPGFFQGRVLDRKLGRRLKCPFCGELQPAISNRRKHMRECPANPKHNLEGVKVKSNAEEK